MAFIWDVEDWQDNVGKWAEKTFPQSSQESIIAHLRDEVNNEIGVDCDPDELADCVMLLLHLAHKRGIHLDQEMRNKFSKNKERKWGNVNSKGFWEHIE